MKKEFSITCPKCKTTFSAEDVLKDHLKEHEKNFDLELKKKESIIESKYEANFKKREKDIEQNVQLKLNKDNQKKIDDFKKAILKKEKEKEDIEKTFKLKEKNLKQEMQKELTSRISSDIEKKKNLEIQNLRKKQEKKEKETEINNRRLQKRLQEIEKKKNEMEKQLKQKSQEIQGEVQEELIQDFLRSKFSDDNVKEIKKGAKGADCILSITDNGIKNIAKIYFESKDAKFNEEWVDKFLKDMQSKGIGFGILVSEQLPKTFRKDSAFETRHGGSILIVPFSYPIIHAVVEAARNRLIEKSKSSKPVNVPKEMKLLWDHVTGPNFQIPIQTLYGNMKKMHNLLDKEKTFLNKNIADKERELRNMVDNLREMLLGFTRQVGDVLPTNLLESKEDED